MQSTLNISWHKENPIIGNYYYYNSGSVPKSPILEDISWPLNPI